MHKAHLYKAKNQAQLDDTSPDPDTVEVRAFVFGASALEDPATGNLDAEKVARAMELVRGLVEGEEDKIPTLSPDASSVSADKVVPIQTPCKLCIGREIKRLTRGPQTPKAKSKAKSKATNGQDLDKARLEETDGQQPGQVESSERNDEVSRASRRMVAMQVKTQAVVDWQLPHSQNMDSAAQLMRAPPASLPRSDGDDGELDADGKKKKRLPIPPIDEGTIGVDMGLRICCYCRHNNEPKGYRSVARLQCCIWLTVISVIFILSDYRRKVAGMTITHPLNINDSHKEKKSQDADKNKKTLPPKPMIQTQGLPGEGVFSQEPGTCLLQPHLPQSHSAPNLSTALPEFNIQPNVKAYYGNSTPPELANFPSMNNSVSATMTPNRSRAASPSAPTNPPKRQRGQGNGRIIPKNLMMTPVSSEPAPTAPPTATFHFRSANTTMFNETNFAPDGGVTMGELQKTAIPQASRAHHQTPSGRVTRQDSAGKFSIANSGTIPPLVVFSMVLPASLRILEERGPSGMRITAFHTLILFPFRISLWLPEKYFSLHPKRL